MIRSLASLRIPVLPAIVATAMLCGCERRDASRPGEPAAAAASAPQERADPGATARVPGEPPLVEGNPERQDRRAVRPTDAADGAAVAPPSDPPTPGQAGRDDRADGPPSQAIGRASDEYHEKLKALRERYADNRDDPKYAQEVLELRRWYASEMRQARMASRALRETAGPTEESK